VIFREQEFRASGINCGRDQGGQFAANNDCAGSSATAAPASDWKQAKGTKEWDSSDLKRNSPIKGGDKLDSLTVRDVPSFRRAQNAHGLNLDEIVTLGGGPIRGSEIWAASYGGKEISVAMNIPVDPDDPDKGSVESSITIDVDEDTKSSFIDYGTMFPDEDVALTDADRTRISSVMMERMLESMSLAHDAGFSYAQTLAIGSKDSPDKGYRLWPQFGFDAKLPKELFDKIPKDLLDKTPRVAKSSKLSRKSLTLQELISTREGERWWDDNGDAIEMTLKFSDDKSLGFKRFMDMKKRLPRLKERNKNRSYIDWLDLVELRDDCGRQSGGRFGQGNNCAVDDGGANVSGGGGSALADRGPKVDTDWWRTAPNGEAKWNSAKIKKSPPVSGGHVLNSFTVPDVGELASAMTDIGQFSSLDDVVTIGGGIRRGADITVEGEGDMIRTKSTMPISPDGSGKDGTAEVNVTLFDNGEGFSISYDELYVDFPEGEEDSPEAIRRVSSVMMERMTESLAKAESLGAQTAETSAAGSATSHLKGYRLWPQFGFDAEIPSYHKDGIREFAEEAISSRGKDSPPAWAARIIDKLGRLDDPLTIQELISSREGQKWWDENGKGINLQLNFQDKSSLGYKRYEKMKALLSRLKDRNKNRNWYDYEAEFRGDCTDADRAEGGRFGDGNDCGGDGGSGGDTAVKAKKSSATKEKSESPSLRWTPGESHVDVFKEATQSNPTKRSPDGKKILSTSIEGAVVTRALGGKEEVDPVSVGRHLLAEQAKHRGGVIDTRRKLEGDDFEYMVSGIAAQVESARERGVAPNFYSPEDRRAQIEEYAKIQPLMRGGRTASGFCVGIEGPNGECEPSEGISPQAEFLFRAAQALTSPEANPFENMLRADAVISAFFEEKDPGKAKLGGGVRIAGAGGGEALKNFARLQKIIDRIGLDETRKLFAEPPMRKGDFKKYFLDRIPGTEGDRYDPNDYSVDELIPLFSIFGPKVGPFFANNTGDEDALTADIWFTRTWARLSGELIEKTSPDLAKKHGTTLMSSTKNISKKELNELGVDGRQFRSYVAEMKRTGTIPQSVISWAEKRDKQYKKDGFPSPDKGTGTQERYELDRLAIAILKNQTRVMRVPTTSVMRSNMIRVMKEAAARTGVPVAYMQDILWQDEQDTWGTLGSRTSTVPGEPSLYSEVIRKIVENPEYRQRRRADKRSVESVGEPMEYEFLSDQKGGIEQALFANIVADMDDDEFADIVIEMLRANAERQQESRNFAALDAAEVRSNDCGRDEGGRFGSGNDCAKEEGGASQPKDDDDLSDIKQIKPSGGSEFIELSRLPSHQQKSAERIREKGVSIRVESAVVSDDSFNAIEQGIAMLAESGIDWPRDVRIGKTGAALASIFPDSGDTIVSDSLTKERARDAIQSGWLSGDVDLPLASILVHEQAHADHYSTLAGIAGSDAVDELWDKITGRHDIESRRREAEKEGRQFRPAAGLYREFAWSPDYRPIDKSSVSAAEAMRIAKTVSGYAETNPPEFVAEFRTSVLSGKTHSDEAWALYESYGGPKLLRRKKT